MESIAISENVVGESNRPNTANLVVNAPEPPSIWEEISLSIKEAIIPRRNKSFSLLRWSIAALQGLFPVLHWGRNYDLKSFRSDLMAGLTLASLGIPQILAASLLHDGAGIWVLIIEHVGHLVFLLVALVRHIDSLHISDITWGCFLVFLLFSARWILLGEHN